MSLRATLGLLIAVLSLSPAAAARYVKLAGAPGFGPAKYASVRVDEVGPRSAKRVLVLIPGTFAGAGSFSGIAPWLAKHVPNLQVWAIDRRPNQLEDTSYMVKALRGQVTAKQAFDYYLGWLGDSSVQPHYQPLDDARFGFAKDWGLKLAMEDTRRVVLAARRGGRRVILGGHSLGASSVYDYATWDFAGRPGFRDLIGMVAIDGGGMTDSEPLADAQQAKSDLDAAKSPWLDLLKIGLPWASGVFQETGAIGVLKDPNGASVGQQSKLLPAEFKPSVPVTNRAQFGYAFDYRTSPAALGLIHIHSGHVAGRAGANGLHGWVDDGITPIDRFARIGAREPGNFTEWYYPARLTIDVTAAKSLRRDPATTFLGLRTWHARQVDLPLYVFQTDLSQGRVLAGAKRFVAQSRVPWHVYVDRSKTYSHLDPLAAAPAHNDFLRTVARFLRRLR